MSDIVNTGRWKKGKSGNPAGRPKNERALANVLRETGEYDSFGDLPNKTLMAQMIWQAVAFGEIRLRNGRTYELTLRDWLDLVKWLNFHVDGSFHAQDSGNKYEKKVIIRPGQNPNIVNAFYLRKLEGDEEAAFNPRDVEELRELGYIHISELEPDQSEDQPPALLTP